MAAPPLNHWYVNGAVPPTATLNRAVCPATSSTDCGCVTIVGATAISTVAGGVSTLAVPNVSRTV